MVIVIGVFVLECQGSTQKKTCCSNRVLAAGHVRGRGLYMLYLPQERRALKNPKDDCTC